MRQQGIGGIWGSCHDAPSNLSRRGAFGGSMRPRACPGRQSIRTAGGISFWSPRHLRLSRRGKRRGWRPGALRVDKGRGLGAAPRRMSPPPQPTPPGCHVRLSRAAATHGPLPPQRDTRLPFPGMPRSRRRPRCRSSRRARRSPSPPMATPGHAPTAVLRGQRVAPPCGNRVRGQR